MSNGSVGIDEKLAKNSSEFSRMSFKSVNLSGGIIGFDNNIALFYLDNIPDFYLEKLDMEKFYDIQNKFEGKVRLHEDINGYGLELFGDKNNFSSSCKEISKIVEELGTFMPHIKEESYDLISGLDDKIAYQANNTTLIPDNMMLVKTYEGSEEVFNIEGWINNTPSRFMDTHVMKIECFKKKHTYSFRVKDDDGESALPDTNEKSAKNNGEVNKFSDKYLDLYLDGKLDQLGNEIKEKPKEVKKDYKEKVEQVTEEKFDPLFWGHPDFLEECFVHEARLLEDRAAAKHTESFSLHPVNSIEAMCSAYEDYERALIIYSELRKEEDPVRIDFKEALQLRERPAQVMLAQMIIIKDLMKNFPSYELGERASKRLLIGIESMYVDAMDIIVKREEYIEETLDAICDDHTPDEQKSDYSSTELNEFESDIDEPENMGPMSLQEARNPIQEYLIEAKSQLQKFRKNAHFLQHTPHEITIPILTKETVEEENNTQDRLNSYEGIIEYCKSEIQNIRNTCSNLSYENPLLVDAEKKVMSLVGELQYFEPLYDELSEIMDYCANRDPLCFDNPMPIKILDDAREYASTLMDEYFLGENTPKLL